jgi:hypothetical protein
MTGKIHISDEVIPPKQRFCDFVKKITFDFSINISPFCYLWYFDELEFLVLYGTRRLKNVIISIFFNY